MSNIYLHKADTSVDELKNIGRKLTAVEARVYEELLTADQGGQFLATVKISVNDRYAGEFKAGAILKMSTPEHAFDYFRITKTTKTLTDITATAWHLSYDLRNNLISDRSWQDKRLSEVWPDLLQAGGANRFDGSSDISTIAGARIVRRSVIDAIVADSVSVKERWGGELERHGFEINMLNRRGSDRGFQVRYGQNLTGINDEVDASEVYHAVLPTYLKDGQTPVAMEIVKSPLYDTAIEPRTVAIHFGDINVGENENDYASAAAAESEVLRRIQQMWAQGADKPRASARIDFVNLADGTDLQNVYLGDTVRAIWEDQIDITQRVISYEWDPLLDKYVQIQLGNARKGIEALSNQIRTIVEDESQRSMAIVSSLIDATLALNEVYINAMGYYRTEIVSEETGARKLYLHDAPLLEDSIFIATVPEPGTYLWTELGWNNGDPVWTQGITQGGNLLIRYIQAVGISADWIETGLLKGGKIFINLDDGTFLIGKNSSVYEMFYDGETLNFGGNTKLSWANISNKPYIPSVPGYITSTKITETTIESPSIIGGVIIGGRLIAMSGNSQKVDIADGELIVYDGNTKIGSLSSSKVSTIAQTDSAFGIYVNGAAQWKVGASDWSGGGYDSGTSTGSYGNILGTSMTGNSRRFNINTPTHFYNNIYQGTSGVTNMSIVNGHIKARSYVDMTPAFTGDALSAIAKVSDDGEGNIDHRTLPEFALAEFDFPPTEEQAKNEKKAQLMGGVIVKKTEQQQGRDLGAMVSILTKAIQELVAVNEEQSNRITVLEKEVLNAK